MTSASLPAPPGRAPHTRLLILLALGLTVLMAAYWRGPLTAHAVQPATWVNMDAFHDDLPDYQYVWGRWRRGDMPLWNPHQLLGTPAAAALQSGVFYPGNVLYLLLPVSTAFVLTTMLHIGLGGWFAGWYAARRGLGTAGVVAAALLAALGSDVLQRWWIRGFIHSSPWIFAALIALDAVCEKPNRRAAVGLAAALAMHLLAGWPQSTVMVVYVLGLRALWWRTAALHEMPAPAKSMAWAAAAAGLWVLLIGAQALPTAELLPEAARNMRGIPGELLESGFQYDWAGLLGEFADATPTVRFKRAYLGLAGLLLVCAGWATQDRHHEVAFWFGMFVLFTLMTLGNNSLVYQLYTLLPSGTLFREPTRFMYCAHTTAVLCAAFGADALWRRLAAMRARAPRAAVGALMGAVVLGAAAVNLYGNLSPLAVLGTLGPYARVAYPWTVWGAAGLAALSVYWWRPSPGMLRAVGVAIAAVWIADLFYANRNLHRVVVQEGRYWLSAEELELDLPDGVAGPRVYMQVSWLDFALPAKWATLTGNGEITDFEVMHVMRKSRFMRFVRTGEAPPFFFYSAGREYIGFAPAHPQLLSLLSVRWMFLRTSDILNQAHREWPAPLRPPFVDRTTPTLRERAILRAENPDALPRAYVVPRARVVADENDTYFTLVAPDFDPRAEVILAAPLPAPPAADSPKPFAATARITTYAPERVVVSVDASAPGYLVLTDAWYPGWYATVNGAAADIARANVLVRAVRVPAGPSEVVFRFTPPVQYVGIVLSLAGLGLCGVLWMWPTRQRPAEAMAAG